MKNEIAFIIDAGIYPFEIMVSSASKENTLQILKEIIPMDEFEPFETNEEKPGYEHPKCYLFESGAQLIWLGDISDNIGIATLNHEILHATFNILRKVGISWTFESEEVFTYLFQYLCVNIYDNLGITIDYKEITEENDHKS